MADLERSLISRLTNTADMARVWDMGLREEVFEEPINRAIFSWMVDYWQDSNRALAPTWVVMETEFPSVPLERDVAESTEWLVDRLKRRWMTNQAQALLRRAATTSVEDPVGSMDLLWREAYEASQVVTPRTNRMDMATSVEERRREYARRRDRIDPGITLGLSELDRHTGGLLPGELAAVGGFSKCVASDTLVFTGDGLVRIGQIRPDLGDGQEAAYRSPISTRDGLGATAMVYHQGYNQGIRITSRFAELVTTGTHRLLTPTEDGLVWTQAQELTEGDQVLMDTSRHAAQAVGESVLPDGSTLTPELARLLGWIIAEGHMRPDVISVSKHSGTEYGDSCREDIIAAVRSLGDEPRINDEAVSLHAPLTRWLIATTGLTVAKSAGKSVPDCILRAPTRLVVEFLRAYFEGDGDYSRSISVTTASRVLADQVAALLLHHVGVVSELSEVDVTLPGWDTPRRYWKTTIPSGDNGRRFAQAVVPLTEWNRARLAHHVREGRALTKHAYVGRVRHSGSWARAVLTHLAAVVPWDVRPRQVSVNNRRPTSYQSLFPDRYPLAAIVMGGRAHLASVQIVDFVQHLTPYQGWLQGMPAWESLQECAAKEYVGSEICALHPQEADFWDFVVTETHSYTANGIMSHNTGKTMYLCQVAAAARCAGHTPLVMTLEMSPPEIGHRIDALYSGVSYARIQDGSLSFDESRRLATAQDELRDMGSIFIEQPPRGERTVKHLTSRARQLDASILIIDQLSFMEGDREYTGERAMTARHGDVIFALKDDINQAAAGRLPCLIAVQLNRDSVRDRSSGGRGSLSNFAHSSLIEQTVDLALGLWRTEEMRANLMMAMDVMGSRRSDLASWLLNWRLGDRTEISVRTEVT